MCKWCKSGANRIDPCMRETVKELGWKGYKVLACCCGHGKYKPSIVVTDHYNSAIWELISWLIIPRKKRFYKKDSEGVYFIPEVAKQEAS